MGLRPKPRGGSAARANYWGQSPQQFFLAAKPPGSGAEPQRGSGGGAPNSSLLRRSRPGVWGGAPSATGPPGPPPPGYGPDLSSNGFTWTWQLQEELPEDVCVLFLNQRLCFSVVLLCLLALGATVDFPARSLDWPVDSGGFGLGSEQSAGMAYGFRFRFQPKQEFFAFSWGLRG